MKKALMGAAVAAFLFFISPALATADTVSVNFENPPYSLGIINGVDGWTSTGAAGSGCAIYDHKVDSSGGTSGFGSQSLRISNAVTSGCFGDQTFSKSLVNGVGETGAGAGSYSVGTLQSHFETEFDITTFIPGHQPGLFLSVSPDRGDGSRMSYIGFSDQPTGIKINFYDVQGTSNPANFVETDLGIYPRTKHHIKLTFDAVNGPSNDVVKVYIDGNLVHIGTSWENYYRFDTEASAEQNVRVVRNVLFRTGGTAAPATNAKGYLIDNLSASSGATSVPSASTIVVHPSDMATSFGDVASNPSKWFFYNDENDTIDNSLGSFVTGPSTPPLGTGSVQISVSGTQRRNLATYQFAGTKLGDITSLKFATYNPSAGNGGSANRSAYLQFNVDFDGSDVWQRRLAFVPNQNGTVVQNSWQEWDAINGGAAKWSHSGATWPVAPAGPHMGQTGIPGTTLRSWNDILADYPGVRIRVSDPWLGMRVGEPYADGYTENLDKFVLATTTVKTFDFDPTPPLSNVLVHIYKFIDGVMATAANANSAIFNMVAVFSSISPPFTGTTFTLGPSSSPAPYTAVTTPIPAGGLFAGFEFTGDSTTGVNCAAGKPFALSGYSTGDTLAQAQAASTSTAMPLLTSLASDKAIIVWNTMCAATSTTGSLIVKKETTGGDDTFNFVGPSGSFTITTSAGVGTNTLSSLTPGSYSVTESLGAGSPWTQTFSSCQNVSVVAGGTANCTIKNTKTSDSYTQSSYYSQGEYWTGQPPGYAQSTYYSQGSYISTPAYSQSSYYSQGAYYSQGSYYGQASYYAPGCPSISGCWDSAAAQNSTQYASVLVAMESALKALLEVLR